MTLNSLQVPYCNVQAHTDVTLAAGGRRAWASYARARKLPRGAHLEAYRSTAALRVVVRKVSEPLAEACNSQRQVAPGRAPETVSSGLLNFSVSVNVNVNVCRYVEGVSVPSYK